MILNVVTLMPDFDTVVARIYPPQGTKTVGCGFLIAPGLVMTAAHVVTRALGARDYPACTGATVTQPELRPFELSEVACAFENRSLPNFVRPEAAPDAGQSASSIQGDKS